LALSAAIVEHSDDAILSNSLDGIVVSWNPGAERIFGYAAVEMIGGPITRLLPDDRLHEESELLAQSMRGNHISHFVTRRIRKNGSAIDVSVTQSPVCDIHGQIVAVSQIARDITEARQTGIVWPADRGDASDLADASTFTNASALANASTFTNASALANASALTNGALSDKIDVLVRNQQRFQCLVRLTSQVIWTNSPEGRMEGPQPAWSAFTGQSYDDYQGFGWSAAVHPEDAEPTIAEWNQAVLGRRPFLFEHRVRRHDGVYRTCTVNAAPVLNDDGSIREWVGVHNDITERRQQEDEMAAQEAKFRFLAESLPQMVWTSRPDGWLDYYNQRWCNYTGMSLQQTQGWGWGQVLHPDDLQNCVRVWNRSIETGEPFQIEYRFRRASDGDYRWHLGRALPHRNAQGGIIMWFGTSTDIHDYKEEQAKHRVLRAKLEDRVRQRTTALETANRDLKVSSGRLERSNRELMDFASVASHDLQEPLRKVQTFGDRLKTRCAAALDEQGLDHLSRMLDASSRMQILIQDLLAFSRVGSRSRSFVAVDLAQVTREVLSDLEIRIAETGARVEVAELPIIDGDPLLIRQLLQNLIGNALKFHKEGQSPMVRLRAAGRGVADAGGFWTLCVEDDGIGFEEKYLDRIFTMFQRLHGRNEYEGTGVGLAICRKIAWCHGGEITASSVPGEGSVFTVTLPAVVDRASAGMRVFPAPLALSGGFR
jgi:two-component system CheB/CheR fusion protein